VSLVLAVNVIIDALYALECLAKTSSLGWNFIGFAGPSLGASLFLAWATARWAPASSRLLLPAALFLNGIGLIEIARWNPARAQYQAASFAAAALGYVAVLRALPRIRELDRYRYVTLVSSIALILLPLVPGLGHNVNGARLWVGVGPISFQPVEFAKILLCVFFASYFAANKELLTIPTRNFLGRAVVSPSVITPILGAWAFALLVLGGENDIGFAILLFLLFITMLWVTTGKTSYVVSGLALFVMGGFVGSKLFYQVHQRISVWLDPWSTWAYAHGGRQILEGWFAISAGGLTGTGVGLGRTGRWGTEVTSDMILSAIGEELGWVGLLFIFLSVLVIVGVSLRTAQRGLSDFSRLVSLGLGATLGFQTFVIATGVFRLLPLTGITVPFVAYGGSSLVANYLVLALLTRLSDESQAPRRGGEITLLSFD
jgi:cell division protein FtsW (lipid II flippase)